MFNSSCQESINVVRDRTLIDARPIFFRGGLGFEKGSGFGH
jgi:hypothetical protein